MKIKGQTLGKVSERKITIERFGMEPLTVTVCALAIGMEREGYERFPDPSPPVRIIRDRKGKPQFGPDGQTLKQESHDDPVYLEACRLASRRQYAWIFFHALAKDPNITWDAGRDWRANPADFFDEIAGEMEEAGFTAGILLEVTNTAMALSGLGDQEVQEARDAFLPRPVPVSHPSSTDTPAEPSTTAFSEHAND